MTIAVIIVVVVVVIAAVVLVVSRRRPADGVSSFQRQIDALSPEARRTVVDQVHHAQGAERDDTEPAGGPDAADDTEGDDDGT